MQSADKGKSMTVRNITCNVKRHAEPCRQSPHDHEAPEIYTIEVLWVEKQIGNAEIFAETARDHCKQHDPAQNQHNISPDVVEEKLNRERIEQFW